MSDPIVDPSDLQVYLQLASINEDRAAMLIGDAQALCETVASPLPAGADQVVRRMAGAACTNPSGARSAQIGTAQVTYGSTGTVSQFGVVLTATDQKDLRRLAGGSSGAFSIDQTPADALTCLPFWDVQYRPPVVTP